MKKFLLLLAFTLILGSNTFAQDGIQFDHSKWSELLAKAESENKLIFVDAYASWCGPCKKMDREVFSQGEVGEFFNAKFVNAKIDMEKGEGVGLASDFGVQAYPTMLFVNSEGDVVHRAVGYHTSDLLLDLADAALDPNRNTGGLVKRYRAGDRSPELLYNLAMAKFDAMDESYGPIAEEYMATQQDWNSRENMEFIYRMATGLDSKMAQHILNNRAAYDALLGDRAVASKLNELVQGSLASAKTEGDLAPIESFLKKAYPEDSKQIIPRLKMGFYAEREDWTNFAKVTDAYYDEYPAESWDELNQIAWMFYEVAQGKKNLKCALGWGLKSIDMESNYFNNDTVAALYYRLGKKKKALAYAQKAIALAEKSGEDHSATDLLLENIRKM